jgi:hypothetical protein
MVVFGIKVKKTLTTGFLFMSKIDVNIKQNFFYWHYKDSKRLNVSCLKFMKIFHTMVRNHQNSYIKSCSCLSSIFQNPFPRLKYDMAILIQTLVLLSSEEAALDEFLV